MKKYLLPLSVLMISTAAIAAEQSDPSIAIATLTARVNNLEEENRRLTGKVDELQHSVEQARKDLAVAAAEAKAAPSSEPVIMGQPGKSNAADGSAVTKSSPYVTKVAPASDGVDNEFDEVFKSVVAEDYKTARPALKAFVTKHPGTSQAGEAYFWLGEIAWSERDFNTAAINYLKGYKEAPTGEKAPENILKMSLTLKELGKKEEACKYVERFETEFPDAHTDLKGKAASAKTSLACK